MPLASEQSQVEKQLRSWQQTFIAMLQSHDGSLALKRDPWEHGEGGGGESCVLGGGAYIEHAGVNFSRIRGRQLPPAATLRRPQLVDTPFEVLGVSIIVHPLNPYIPSCHANGRFFSASPKGEAPVWWFGGGFDLTPYYGFKADVVAWHQEAKAACDVLSPDAYTDFKTQCDQYFFLKHRGETRGVGGLFFDDLNAGGFAHCFAFMQAMMHAFTEGYSAIVAKRRSHVWGDRERAFQLYRRGRYVEFNLLYDRGTLFGLQSGGRTESILVSLPPLVRWSYQYQPEPGSPEASLVDDFLKPRDWLS